MSKPDNTNQYSEAQIREIEEKQKIKTKAGKLLAFFVAITILALLIGIGLYIGPLVEILSALPLLSNILFLGGGIGGGIGVIGTIIQGINYHNAKKDYNHAVTNAQENGQQQLPSQHDNKINNQDIALTTASNDKSKKTKKFTSSQLAQQQSTKNLL